jgi:7,8-dihydropterin-6-yl-methyl-4-(beta-D-ribofuranosyl)aminobenzene 5'-phosphate synthase
MEQNTVIRITTVYDNKPFTKGLIPDWGFSCFIDGLTKGILFDTGAQEKTLWHNLDKLRISPEQIDIIVLSHFHKDHTGGLLSLLKHRDDMEVWLPEFFPEDFKMSVRKTSAKIIEVNGMRQICPGAFTTGVIKGWIKEQSLVLRSNQGLVLVTGCAHPRLTQILDEVRGMFNSDIYMILGGFHLAGFTQSELQEIASKLRDIGIEKIAPCHCSGQDACSYLRERFPDGFLEMGVGQKVELA